MVLLVCKPFSAGCGVVSAEIGLLLPSRRPSQDVCRSTWIDFVACIPAHVVRHGDCVSVDVDKISSKITLSSTSSRSMLSLDDNPFFTTGSSFLPLVKVTAWHG